MEIYLDNAATSHPKPVQVINAVNRALTLDNANPGRSGHMRAIRAAEIVLNAREEIAHLIDASDPFEIAFTFNCTDSLNLAIKGSLNQGDHAVCSALEHNSVLRVLSELAESRGITFTIVNPEPTGIVSPFSYEKAIKTNTRLLILTHASNVTGAIQPVCEVGAIAKAHGIPFLVDGAQTLGMHRVSVKDIGCQMYAFPGHKGLLAPQGTGGLFIAPSVRLKTLREGGTGSSSESIRQPEELPERYEAGTLNLPGIAGLSAGCKFVETSLDQIILNERRMSQYLFDGLSKIPSVTVYSPKSALRRTGVIAFNIADHPSGHIAEKLSEFGICVRGGLHCAPKAHEFLSTQTRGAVRASVSYATSESDVESLLKSVHCLSRT